MIINKSHLSKNIIDTHLIQYLYFVNVPYKARPLVLVRIPWINSYTIHPGYLVPDLKSRGQLMRDKALDLSILKAL